MDTQIAAELDSQTYYNQERHRLIDDCIDGVFFHFPFKHD